MKTLTSEDLTHKLLTGEVVKNHNGTFYFSQPGNWIDSDGDPIVNKLHREDGPAIEHTDGTKIWLLNGEYHREDGPAIEFADGTKEWFLNGEYHREDGPAIEFADGTKEWFLNGIQLTEEQFNQQMKSK